MQGYYFSKFENGFSKEYELIGLEISYVGNDNSGSIDILNCCGKIQLSVLCLASWKYIF